MADLEDVLRLAEARRRRDARRRARLQEPAQTPQERPQRLQQEEPEEDTGGGFGGLVRRLTSPLVDVPELPGGFIGDIIEEGIEGTSSPIGLLSTALIPVTGGASLGLRGAAGAGARLATRGAAEVAVGGAAGTAAREVEERLPENTPGALRLGAALLSGAAAGGATAAGISRATRRGAGEAVEGAAREVEIPATSPEARTLAQAISGARTLNRRERRSVLAQQRQEQAGRAAAAREAATRAGRSFEGGQAARGATRGAFENVRFENLTIEPETINALKSQINDAPPNVLQTLSKHEADRGLNKILAGVVPNNSELKALERVFGEGIITAITAKRGFGSKLMTAINAPRAIVASADFSAPLRQGVVLAPGHPASFARNFTRMLRTFADKDYYEQAMRELRGETSVEAAAKAARREAAGLELTGTMTNVEEAFIGRGFFRGSLDQTLAGRTIAASERAYSFFLNKLRADVFDDFARQLDSAGLDRPDSLKQYAEFLNRATGRGKLPHAIERSVPLLNAGFFAPRYNISRFMAPTSLFTADDVVRREVAKDLGRFVGAGLAGMTLLKVASDQGIIPDLSIETNPRSTDFGKIRVGSNRYDFWGGYQQLARAIAQTATGERKTTGGNIVDENRAVILGRFFQSKLSPSAGLAVDVLRGESYIGERLTTDPEDIGEQAKNRLLPLAIQDFEEGFAEGGWGGGTASIPALFGVGYASYASLGETKNRVAQELFDTDDWRDLTGAQQEAVNQHPLVLEKEAEFDQRSGNDFGEQIDNVQNELALTQRALMGRLANGDFTSRRNFADALEEATLRAAVRRDQAALDFGIENRDPASPLQIALSGWRDLYTQADLTYDQGVVSGQIDWELFDQLEQEYLASLTQDQRDFIDNRKRATHDPTVQWYYNNKDYISNSGYYDIVDEAFERFRSQVQSRFPEVENYGDLLALESQAQQTFDQRLLKRVRLLKNRIDRRADDRKERLRRTDPKLDRALLENGRTTTLKSRAARNLGTSTALD